MTDPLVLPGLPEPRAVDEVIGQLLDAPTSAPDAELERARAELRRAAIDRHVALTSGALSGWLQLWRDGLPSVLIVEADEHCQYSRLARAALRLDGHLQGPDIRTTGPVIAQGEQLVATTSVAFGEERLDAGAPMRVARVDAATGSILLDVPTAGLTIDALAHEPAWRSCEHAYAEIDNSQGRTQPRSAGVSW